MFCSLRQKYQKKEIQYHWNEIQLKEIASSLRFQFSFESNFYCSSCVVVLSFCFSLLQRKKERVIYFLLPSWLVPTLHLISLKKRGFILLPLRFVISSTYFFQKYFSSQLSCSHPLSYCCSILNPKKKKKKKTKTKTKSRRFQLFTLKVLFTLVSQGCRKSKKTTRKLVARQREVLCLVSLFKIFFDLGVLFIYFFVLFFFVYERERERERKQIKQWNVVS